MTAKIILKTADIAASRPNFNKVIHYFYNKKRTKYYWGKNTTKRV